MTHVARLSWWIAAAALLGADQALATVAYTVSGSGSNNHYGIQTHESVAGGIGVEYLIGERLSLGLNHRQEFVKQDGHKEVIDGNGHVAGYREFAAESRIISNAANVTVNVYNGPTVVPYVFVGLVKSTVSSQEIEEGEAKEFHGNSLGPQAGLGFAVRVSKEFAVKLSYTASPGSIIADPGQRPEESRYATNSYAQIGVTYKP